MTLVARFIDERNTEVGSQVFPFEILFTGVLPMRNRILPLAAIAMFAVCVPTRGADWITAPSAFTHDPQTGQRVDQYTPVGPFYSYARSDFVRSGYRHTRSALQVGESADNMHIVEEWGRPVRPYGEWRFPYRPYSAPYSMWGAPFAGTGYPVPGPYSQSGYGARDGVGMGPGGANPPWFDGRYPSNRPAGPGRPPHGRPLQGRPSQGRP